MMNSRKHVVLITSLGVALALAASQAFGGSLTKRYVRDQFVADSYVVDTGPDVGRYTCTLDIPWDWVHRCPPLGPLQPPSVPVVIPYTPPCPAPTVTFSGVTDGSETSASFAAERKRASDACSSNLVFGWATGAWALHRENCS